MPNLPALLAILAIALDKLGETEFWGNFPKGVFAGNFNFNWAAKRLRIQVGTPSTGATLPPQRGGKLLHGVRCNSRCLLDLPLQQWPRLAGPAMVTPTELAEVIQASSTVTGEVARMDVRKHREVAGCSSLRCGRGY
ncbi:hypothetical protein E2562_038451 [Oryza meyeriana var. granulata]|uniref:Uncharacterized protein n=1 Tax=Oryza meyeriana var. granulata TaxID=110450 RepID=A0A6G1C3F5_9ORYZ|nr:hypothetical protein E2562_038451 [Oryza meyeriana var. granulata]